MGLPVERLGAENDASGASVVPLVRLQEPVFGIGLRDKAIHAVAEPGHIKLLAADESTVDVTPPDRDAAYGVTPAAPVVLSTRGARCLR